MSKVMISLSGMFLREIDAVAKAEHRSRSELVREAVREYVARRPVPHDRRSMRAAVERILSAKLRLPKGHTTVSLIRELRETRYGSKWKRS